MELIFLLVAFVAAMVGSWRYADGVAHFLHFFGIDSLLPWADLHVRAGNGFDIVGEAFHRFGICLVGMSVVCLVLYVAAITLRQVLDAVAFARKALAPSNAHTAAAVVAAGGGSNPMHDFDASTPDQIQGANMAGTTTEHVKPKASFISELISEFGSIPAMGMLVICLLIIGAIANYFYHQLHLREQLDTLASVSIAGDASQQFSAIHKRLIAIENDGYAGAVDEHNRVVKREEALLADGMAKGEAGAFAAVYGVRYTDGEHLTEYDYESLRYRGWPFLAKAAAVPGQSAAIYRYAADVYQEGNLTTRDSYRAIDLYKKAWTGGDTTVAMPLAQTYISVGDPANAYLWSLRALPPNPGYDDPNDAAKAKIEGAIAPMQRPAIQAQAGNPKILTTASAPSP